MAGGLASSGSRLFRTQKFFPEASMKHLLLWTVLCLAFAGVLHAQNESVTETSDRMFFPHDMLWGFAQFDLAPPHNEIDPNLCAGNAGNLWGSECSLQHVCPLYALGAFGGASFRKRPVAPVHVVWPAFILVWQKHSAHALYLVA